jgi:hypothetical protein
MGEGVAPEVVTVVAGAVELSQLCLMEDHYQNHGLFSVFYERMTEEEQSANPALLDVKVNYKKTAQDVTVDLRPMNPLYDGAADSTAETFYPVILITKWMPSEAIYAEERSVGLSILCKPSEGTPSPHPLRPWAVAYKNFMRDMHSKFPRDCESYIFDDWDSFLKEQMPLVPNASIPMPSDDIYDFVFAKGGNFQPPLGKYLYGERPLGFEHLRVAYGSSTTSPAPSTLDTAFTGIYAGKEVSFINEFDTIIPFSPLIITDHDLSDMD